MKESNDSSNNVWMFHFALEREDGKAIEKKYASELLEYILAWAEKKDYQIGGGFFLPKDEDNKPFELKDE